MPPRHSDNDKRRLHPAPDPIVLRNLAARVTYRGIAKHKAAPARFGLPPYTGPRGDESLCDDHASVEPEDMPDVRKWLVRGIDAGRIGHVERAGVPTIVWTVSDHGWIFEARVTNAGQAEYHGYPVRPSGAIAAMVIARFGGWANADGSEADRRAVENCRLLYRIAG